MTLDLDQETRRSLVDELQKHIPIGEQKRVAYAIARALGNADSTGVSMLSRLLHKHEDVIDQWLRPDRAETVLGAICRELELDMAELVRAAQRAAGQRPRSAPDRHPAWQELGEGAPWVDQVPGLPEGTETLRRAISEHGQRVVWLVGPAGSGKSARLWRAQQAQIGRLVGARIPDQTERDAVWLVDEPAEPAAWIAGAARCKARLVIATRAAKQRREGQAQLELQAWARAEAESFLGQLGDARGASAATTAAVDLEHITDKLAALGGGWTPLELGHLIRLFVDEPALLALDANDRELHVRSAIHGMLRRAQLSPDQERLWSERGRQACALAAAAAVRSTAAGRPLDPIGEDALREALAELVGVKVGGEDGEPLRAILEQARRASRKSGKGDHSGEGTKVTAGQILQKLEAWARIPSSDDLLELLVALGAWRRTGNAALAPTDVELALTFAAEHLDDDWMWRRLRDTLADPDWAIARIAWAPRLDHVEERIDELLATDAAAHVGAIELAAALVAFARGGPRPDQVERAVSSAVRLLTCHPLTRIGLAPPPALRDVVKSASRRHRRTLPAVTTALTRAALEERCTEGTRRVVGAAERLAEDGPEWLQESRSSELPEWIAFAELMPWQALTVLQEREGRDHLRFATLDREIVLMDHATDGHAWARAVAIGDVEDIQETLEIVSSRGLLRALERWPAPRDPHRHMQALAIVLNGLAYENDASRSRLHTKVVRAIVDFVRRYPDHSLPDFRWLQRDEAAWREALDRAAAVHHLRAWLESKRQEISRAVALDPTLSGYLDATPSRLSPAVAESVACVLRLGEVLHRHGVPESLCTLLEETEPQPLIGRASVAWELGVGAADALLRLRDAASLRSLREPRGSARGHAVSTVLSRESHDEETVLWIAEHLGDRYDEVLESIVDRPERREIARRWAQDASASLRRHAAAGWLLSHPASGEHEHVRWLLTQLPVELSLYHVGPALAHPDEDIGAAASALLPRALAQNELGADADLVAVARSFFDPGPGSDDVPVRMVGLERYLDQVNASRHVCSPQSIQTLIELTQRHLATAPDEQSWRVTANVCSSLATAARRLRLPSLAAWVRDPLGAHAEASPALSRVDAVRTHIISGILRLGDDAADLDLEVLQEIASTAGPLWAIRVHSLLLEREPLNEAELLTEWSAVSDAVLVDLETAPTRFYAVQDQLRRRAPRVLARALADRLLALSPRLRRFGVAQISQVATLDVAQAARLSPLFD